MLSSCNALVFFAVYLWSSLQTSFGTQCLQLLQVISNPPYHNTEGYYQNVGEEGFTEREHLCLRELLLGIQGKFLLSYNDDGFIRELYSQPGISLMEIHRIHNMRQRFEGGSRFSELLIANYDLRERETLGQTSLFQPEYQEDSICDL